MHPRLRFSLLALWTLAPLTLASLAHAADDPVAVALYEEGTAAMDKGDFATACPKLEEVVRRVPDGVGAKLTLAECYQGAGRLASAWNAYRTAEAAAAKAGQTERRQKAAAGARALAGKVARIAVVVPEALRGVEGLQVLRDGVSVDAEQWGVEVPVDGGRHVFAVEATGRRRLTKAIDVRDGEATRFTVELGEPLAPQGVAPPADEPSRSLVLPGLALGAAVVGFGVAGVSTGLLLDRKATIADECDEAKRCSPSGIDAVDQVPTFDAMGTAGFAVGAVGAAGLLTWLLWPSATDEGAVLSPAVAPGFAGMYAERVF